MKKTNVTRVISVVVVLTVVLGTLFAWRFAQIRQQAEMMSQAPPPVEIEVAQAAVRRWPQSISAIGGLRAVNGVQVANEIAGVVESLEFESGQQVESGDVLITDMTDLDWEPPQGQDAATIGAAIMLERGIHPNENCSTCHR